ncbi:MAG: 2-amino-4-hydroxy-6-hydroxymethyldihydropteridine diphosphokinase [Rikenellaceae bacterium]
MKVTLLTGGNFNSINTDINSVHEHINAKLGHIIRCSSIRKSEAWGFTSEHYFLNQVIIIETELSPDELLFKIWDIERLYGRDRGDNRTEYTKWQERDKKGLISYKSRRMDIDILYYGDLEVKTDYLQIPHKEIRNREFVTVLLDELSIDWN